MPERVIVIGSGFGGLAVAARLAAQGYDVEVFEKQHQPGGRASSFETSGFVFDAGPTVITAPHLFDELFALSGKRREDYVTFVPVEPFYRIFDHKGSCFEYNADLSFVLEQIERWNPKDKRGYLRFLASTSEVFQKGLIELGDKPFIHVADMLRVAPDLLRLKAYKSVYEYVSQYIEDEFLRRCFSFHSLLIGGNPFEASAIYAMIHAIEREWGVWYARGGTGALVRALVHLIEELGGHLHLDSEVSRILVNGGRAVGVQLIDGTTHLAEHVVSNADVAFTNLRLIDSAHRGLRNSNRRYLQFARYSMSLVVIYFGTNRQYRDGRLAHHNIILGQRYRGLLQDVFHGKRLPEDFSLYLHMPAITDPAMAPPGHESFYVLAPVPHLGADIDWSTAAGPYKDAILAFLEQNYLPDLRQHLVVEHMIDPRYFRDELNSHLGSGFSLEPILSQSAWFRPHNRSEDIPNLYFVGAGTHPGAGLPGVVLSAKIVANLIGGTRRAHYHSAAGANA
jgi:phytoene desaturase